MKLLKYIPVIFCFGLLMAGSCNSNKPGGEEGETPGPPVLLGDPFIMLHNGTYYAYGTYAEKGIEVFTSDDLLVWEKQADLALHADNSWGGRWFWAPEVYHVDGKFYMYYSANEHICVATADSPLGPFVQDSKEPQIADQQAIDNSLFIDDDGTPYLYFDLFNDGLKIWVAQLKEDLKTIIPETMTKCINVSQEWEEVWPRVNEGCFVMKHKGLYYMTYSANSYESPFYGIGVATADNPYGPWTKYEDNPVYQKEGGLVGIGHSAMFTDKNGKLRIVFHAHYDKSNIHPRIMYIADVWFTEDDVPRMVIGGDIVTPKLKRK